MWGVEVRVRSSDPQRGRERREARVGGVGGRRVKGAEWQEGGSAVGGGWVVWRGAGEVVGVGQRYERGVTECRRVCVGCGWR